ncbi:MAG: hypothetical protein AAFZ07_29865, partial [Actinomycetota bacterium]
PLSHFNSLRPNNAGSYIAVYDQAWQTSLIDHPGIELVSLVEPGTTHHAGVELTLRDFQLTAGLIELTDTEALRTLDVIMIGNRLFHEPRTTEHVLEVVREGIGLCKIGNTHDGPHLNADPTLCELSLAQPPIRHYCSGTIYGSLEGHGLPVPGRVASSHPAMPWLEPGHAVTLPSCGNICFPSP